MAPLVENTVVGLWSAGEARLVRVETRSTNMLYALGAGGTHEIDMGVVSLGAADLWFEPDAGWRVVRLLRVTPTSEVDVGALDLSEALVEPHVAFTACVDDSSRVSAEKLSLLPKTAISFACPSTSRF